MDKASNALRRSSVRLKSFNTGHGDLNVVLSDLHYLRSTAKAFLNAQFSAWQSIVKWSGKERNSAFQDSFQHFFELNALWSEVQRGLIGDLKKFKHQFEIILDGEQLIDKSRAHLSSCEQKEKRIRQELRKATDKGNSDKIKECEEKLTEAHALIMAAHREVSSKTRDLEAEKVKTLKEGLTNLSEAYLEMAEKACIIFDAQRDVSVGLPDVRDGDIQNVKYTGAVTAQRCVLKAKETLQNYKRPSSRRTAPSVIPLAGGVLVVDPPSYSQALSNSSRQLGFVQPLSNNTRPTGAQPVNLPSSSGPLYDEPPFEPGLSVSPPLHTPAYPPRYDETPRENYENIPGAVGGLHVNDY